MNTLHTQVEYKEFETAIRAPAPSRVVLQRTNRRAEPQGAAPAPPPSLLRRYAAASATPETKKARNAPLAEIFARLGRRAP